MTETRQSSSGASAAGRGRQQRRRTGIGLFVRQTVAELKKVVRPTRSELMTYTSVVLVFVLAVMVFVSLLDYGFGKLVLWVFGGTT